MALDIHLASSKAKAEQLHPSLSFDETIHNRIFRDQEKMKKNYPLLSRLSDYYNDAYYAIDEIEDVINEVKIVMSKEKNTSSIKFLQQFLKICDLAINEGKNIYCFCD
jgi:hypothetical protein